MDTFTGVGFIIVFLLVGTGMLIKGKQNQGSAIEVQDAEIDEEHHVKLRLKINKKRRARIKKNGSVVIDQEMFSLMEGDERPTPQKQSLFLFEEIK